ncbi:hypothetical protein Y1Q_0007800 [Alligator mississippiensis]|uniref:Uncharacterized protein n=1 Tax=Alligator mississippiensis TaxID=8496 RepID=A0A151N7W6_ALLMI|nr:hypothetical protein Y1Q_0007800 [Alligator mississippiensis]
MSRIKILKIFNCGLKWTEPFCISSGSILLSHSLNLILFVSLLPVMRVKPEEKRCLQYIFRTALIEKQETQ